MNKILVIDGKDSAVSNYRLKRPLTPLKANFKKSLLRKNDEVTLEELAKRLYKKGNVWVIKYIDDFYTLDVLFSAREIVNSKIVVDIDDDIWTIPQPGVSASDYANRAMMVTESCRLADWVTVSTKSLKSKLTETNENTCILENLIDPDEWNFKRRPSKKVKIAWTWNPVHNLDKPVIEPVFRAIKEKYGDKVEIVIFGTDRNLFTFETKNVPAVKYTDFPRVFMEEGIDVAVAPLRDHTFNYSKSNTKWLEATMAGAAFIGSRMDPYKVVSHNKTGMLARLEGEWVEYLSDLIENKKLRDTLVRNAKKEVLKNYNVKTNKDYENFYKSI